MRIVIDELTHPAVVALIEFHLSAAFENSPPGSVFALDLDGLRDPAVTLWSAWEADSLLGLAALRELDPGHGELKSMRTAREHLRRGVARAMLDHLIAEARRRGYRRLSLETGSSPAFAPARALYEQAGFSRCGPFAGYGDDPSSAFFSLVL